MNLLSWITVGFIAIGFIVLISMKKSMEERVAIAKEYGDSVDGEQISIKPVVWWIIGVTVWGLVSICLAVWSFFIFV